MQAIKLTLDGSFWDSHIYTGKMYLFDRQGAICVLDWDELVGTWAVATELKLAMQCAFSRSDYLYGSHWKPMFGDVEVKPLIESKFARLSALSLEMRQLEWQRFQCHQQDSPFPFPHTDAKLYAKRMYVSADSGVFHSNCGTRSVRGVSSRVKKDWDGNVLSMATYSNTLALAAGDDGLFEKRIGVTWWQYEDDESDGESEVKQVTNSSCNSCEWAYYSIFGSSNERGGFLAAFEIDRQPTGDIPLVFLNDDAKRRRVHETSTRTFDEVITANDIFNGNGYAWANREKLYQAQHGTIKVVRYQPWLQDEVDRFEHLQSIQLAPWKGDVVSAGVSVFGTVVECDACIVVILSDGTPITIPGEPVRWRAFPRSKHYENQLHIIYEDRLEVWSFNQDYFVDQESKLSGIRHIERP